MSCSALYVSKLDDEASGHRTLAMAWTREELLRTGPPSAPVGYCRQRWDARTRPMADP
jgi:hypothetical protein